MDQVFRFLNCLFRMCGDIIGTPDYVIYSQILIFIAVLVGNLKHLKLETFGEPLSYFGSQAAFSHPVHMCGEGSV